MSSLFCYAQNGFGFWLWLTMNLAQRLEKSSNLMMHIDQKLDGLSLKSGMAAEASGALLHLSLEHFGAIVVLLKNGLSASAAALVRLQYEALIRGMYYYQCASEEDAELFFSGKSPPHIKDMISSLEMKPGFMSAGFSKVHAREWKTLNSYTHGGSEQVQRRRSGSELLNNYTEADCVNVLKASNAMAIVAAAHAAISCGALELAQELKEEYKIAAGEL